MPLELTPDIWGKITDTHWEMRGDFTYRRDDDLYGQSEHWAIPTGPDIEGDCEDFALACSQHLIAAGVGWNHQAVAFCITETGGGHLVLFINTDRGVFVLDNRQKTVVGYDVLAKSYQFVAQSQWGRSMTEAWISINDPV